MAIVLNLSGNIPAGAPNTDNRLSSVNRVNAGSPQGSVTPQFVGEIIMDSTNRLVWQAFGSTNASWQPAAINIQ